MTNEKGVEITGVHVHNPRAGVVEVSVEVQGKWRRVFYGTASEFSQGNLVDHYVYVAGIERAPIVGEDR